MVQEDRPDRYRAIIVGAGPAGMTSALYLGRKGIEVMVVSKDIGGQVNWTTMVENYMGFVQIQGPELVKRFEQQMRSGNLTYVQDEVQSVQKYDGNFQVATKNSGPYEAEALIVATGKRPRILGIPGEDEFARQGIAYGSTADAPLFANQDVAVVGGGNSGAEAVFDLLAANAAKVYLITDGGLTCDRVLIDRLERDSRIEVLLQKRVTKLSGDRFLSFITVEDKHTTEETVLPVEGVFVHIGLGPNSAFLDQVQKNEVGEVVIDSRCRTSIPGIFAAGDVTTVPEKQIMVAAGEGAKAAIQVWEYLMNK